MSDHVVCNLLQEVDYLESIIVTNKDLSTREPCNLIAFNKRGKLALYDLIEEKMYPLLLAFGGYDCWCQ